MTSRDTSKSPVKKSENFLRDTSKKLIKVLSAFRVVFLLKTNRKKQLLTKNVGMTMRTNTECIFEKKTDSFCTENQTSIVMNNEKKKKIAPMSTLKCVFL